MLQHRLITAAILFAIAGIVLFILPPLGFAVACWLMCLIAIYELTQMYKFSLIQSAAVLIINTAVIIAIDHINYDFSQIIRIVAVTVWCFIVPMILIFTPKKFPKMMIAGLASVLFIPAYYSLVVIHGVLGSGQLVSLMAVAWIADSGAYFVGKAIGRRKLAPRISPGKSIEGAAGGVILVIIYLLTLKYFNVAVYLLNYRSAIKFALILTVISVIGDLFESWLKRVAQVKDSGNILPGHGGIFDRIDSLIAVLSIGFALIWVAS